jgi:hypothetical protein
VFQAGKIICHDFGELNARNTNLSSRAVGSD